MDPFTHGDTIPLIFSVVFDLYYGISEPCDIFYRLMKVIHQIGKKIHGLIHDMAATHGACFVDSFDVLSEIICRDIISIIDYASRLEHAYSKRHSYDSPPSKNDDLQGASPHVLCLQHTNALMHDLGIRNIFTKSLTKSLSFNSFK